MDVFVFRLVKKPKVKLFSREAPKTPAPNPNFVFYER